MDRLKSKTGCLTCLARRKKCDEVVPQCGHCGRLGLNCVRRDQLSGSGSNAAAISSTNLKATKGVLLRASITNGHPPFGSDFEKQLSIESPGALAALVSCMAGPGFRDVLLFGTFSAESRLVRQALVAFSAYNQGPRCGDSYKLSLRSYQNCVLNLRSSRLMDSPSSTEQNYALTAIMFLGLLEGLKIGDSSNAVTHFEMCRKLLTIRLSQPGVLGDAALVKLYRVVAECIIYNLAALSPFHTTIDLVVTCWGTSFDCLFPGGDHKYSPFLGGFHDVYRLMLRINMHLRNNRSGTNQDPSPGLNPLWAELRALETKMPASYRREVGAEATQLYRAKHKISVLALRVHLLKVSYRATTPSNPLVRICVDVAVGVLREQDIREPGNPALRWPLTILACAAQQEDEFRYLVGRMSELEAVLDLSNSSKIKFAIEFLTQYRAQELTMPLCTDRGPWMPTTQLDFLLEPQFLEGATILGA